jgi:hypothetical protein
MLRQQWLWTQKAGLSASYQFVRRATNVRFPPFVSIDANGPKLPLPPTVTNVWFRSKSAILHLWGTSPLVQEHRCGQHSLTDLARIPSKKV